MLISSFKLEKGPIISPLLQFYLGKGIILKRIYWVLEYKPRKTFDTFVQSVVDARRAGDLNSQSAVVAETMKLIGNSSYGYQIMDRSKHSKTKYGIGSQINQLVNSKYFKSLNEIPGNIVKVELTKRVVEHKEPIIVGFFILQYAKLTMLQLYYNFFNVFCDRGKFELIEMDTDSLYMALSESNIEDIIQPKLKFIWDLTREDDCRTENFTADGFNNFFPRKCCNLHAKFDHRTPGLFKEEFRCTEMVALCSKSYCCFDENTNSMKISCEGINKNLFEEKGSIEKFCSVLFNQEKVTSINRGFRVVNNSCVQTYELEKRGLSYLYPKRKVLNDGIHTVPLDL